MEEHGRLQCMGLQRVGHDGATKYTAQSPAQCFSGVFPRAHLRESRAAASPFEDDTQSLSSQRKPLAAEGSLKTPVFLGPQMETGFPGAGTFWQWIPPSV